MLERLKALRKQLHLSQEFVAIQLGMTKATLVAIESGNRKIMAEELDEFSKFYGVSVEEMLDGKINVDSEVIGVARDFSVLSDADKKEILSLMDFKRRYKESISA